MRELFILENIEMPWGDYGEILLSGISGKNENGQVAIERTGPFIPHIFISGLWDLTVSNTTKILLESSNLTGFSFESIIKKKIVEIPWEKWSFSSDDPGFYPNTGEPEGYIVDGKHSENASELMGEVWLLKLNKVRRTKDQEDTLKGDYDFFMPEDKGIILVSEKAKDWLEDKRITDWIQFKMW